MAGEIQHRARIDGLRNGRLDKLLGIRSEYVWFTSTSDPNETVREYAKAYRYAWNDPKNKVGF